MKYYYEAEIIRKLAGKTITILGKDVFEEKGKYYFKYLWGDDRRKVPLVVDSNGKLWVVRRTTNYSTLELLGVKVCKLTGVRTPELRLVKINGKEELLSELIGNPSNYSNERLVGDEAAATIVPRLVLMCNRPNNKSINPKYLDIDINGANHIIGFDSHNYEIDFEPSPILIRDAVLLFLWHKRANLDCERVWKQVEIIEKVNKTLLLWGVDRIFKRKIKLNISSLRTIVNDLIAHQVVRR
ncbi:MAG: hypothetical protein ABIH82_00475 [Candidatus Woesearchaeota archaeon]